MYRNVTAVYRTRETADLVRRGLEELGLSSSDIHVIPHRDHPVTEGTLREESDYSDRLHALHLPEDDLRTYQHCVRRGDYVVSAEVEDRDLDRVKAVMRRPEEEAHHLESRAAEFRSEPVIPHSAGDTHALSEDERASVLAEHNDPYARTYERRKPLRGAQLSP